ncbi:MAG: 3-hydroxyacyl-CoA dehydrogenase NAD-binding domain-containing protein [Polyangiales bacterium]
MAIIETKIEDGVAILTWDQKDRSMNVLNGDSLAELDAAVKAAVADANVKGIVLTSGKKGIFVAGGDLEQIEKMGSGPMDAEDLLKRTGLVLGQLRRMETCGKPVVAALNGVTLGGGYEIALACHHRILVDSRGAKVGLPEAGMGLMPAAGGTVRLPRLLGIQSALGLMLEGKQLGPEEALKKGLVHQVVSEDQLIPAAKKYILEGGKAVQPWDEKGYKVPGGGIDSPGGLQTLMGSIAMIHANTYGNFPHAKAILGAVYEGMKLPVDRAGKVETRYFLTLLQGPVARNMLRTLFFGIQNAQKGVRRPKDVPAYEVKKLGILGAGLMGAGIAFVSAKAGLEVVLLDREQAAADKGKQYTADRLGKDLAKGRTTEEKVAKTLAKIHATTKFEDLAGCDVIVEAVFENRDVKADVTKKADAVLTDAAIFGSNTSALPITGLAQASSRPKNFIGMHFFSPVERMQLVEVIRGKETSDETLAKTYDFVKRIGKTAIVVNDSRGFYTSRVFGTYITEGGELLKNGVEPAMIENCGKQSGMPMPPLALSDEVGLALMRHSTEQAKKDLGDAYESNSLAEAVEVLVEKHGREGKRNGKGFYDYAADGSKSLWPGLREIYPIAAEQPSKDEVIRRFLFTQCLETARCIEAGVITSVEDCDVGAVLGWGFAAFTGGPCAYMDTYGIPAFVAECDRLAAKYGKRFEPPQLLRDMAKNGKTFYGA